MIKENYFSRVFTLMVLNFAGENCEEESSCIYLPCGEGQCLQKGEGYVCMCDDGTTRLSCDEGVYRTLKQDNLSCYT